VTYNSDFTTSVTICSFFWVILRRVNFMCGRLGTHCQVHLHKWCPAYTTYEDGIDSVPYRWHIKFTNRGITQKKEHNIQNTAKVLNQEVY